MGLHTTNPPPTSPTHGPNRYKTLPARPKTPKSGHFSRAGRIFSRFHHQSTTHPVQNSPSNSHPRAQPVQNSPSNTHPLAQPVQNSPSTPTINEIRPFQARRENFLPVPPPRHRAGRTFSRFQHQSTTHPVQNSPRNSHPGLNRYKTLPARPKTPKSGHFKRAGRTFSRFNHHATEQGELSPASNTTLVPISTQLTGWSPLSPGHQTNAPLSWALCGLSAAHHDVAPERAGTDRRLADWNWPRHPQTSSQQPASRANAIDVRPIIHRLVSNRELSTGSCAGLECNVQPEHS